MVQPEENVNNKKKIVHLNRNMQMRRGKQSLTVHPIHPGLQALRGGYQGHDRVIPKAT